MTKKNNPADNSNQANISIDNELDHIQNFFMKFIYSNCDPISIWKVPGGLKVKLSIKKQIDMLYHSICVDANQAAVEGFGLNNKIEITGKEYIALLKERTYNQAFFDFIKNGYLLRDYETHRVLNDGDEYYGLDNWYGIVENDQLVYLCAMSRNITDRKKAEQIFNTKLHYNERILSTMLDGFILADIDGQLVWVNPAYCAMVGYSEAELLKMNIREIEVISPPKQAKPRMEKMINQRSARFESKHKHKDGRLIDLEVCIVILQSDDIPLVAAFFHDITEYKKAEKALQEERNKAQKYLDIAGTIIVALDAKGEVILINQKGSEILGYKQDKIIGKNWFNNFLHPDIEKEVKTVFHKFIEGEAETIKYSENPILTKDSEVKIIAWHNTLLTDDKGNTIGTLSSGEDITERKQAEDELKEHRVHLEELVRRRTEELEVSNQEILKRSEELEAFNKMMLDRETRIIEIKEEVNALCRELGCEIKYPPVWIKK